MLVFPVPERSKKIRIAFSYGNASRLRPSCHVARGGKALISASGLQPVRAGSSKEVVHKSPRRAPAASNKAMLLGGVLRVFLH